MFPGGCPTMAPGNCLDMILSLTGSIVGGQAFIVLKPWDYYRERYWTLFINGKWIGYNFYVPATGDVTLACNFDQGTSIASIRAYEVGLWDDFDGTSIPSADAELQEQVTAKRLLIKWKAGFVPTAISDDTQLGGTFTILGARRGRNVQEVEFCPQRGRLTYSIVGNTPNAGDRLLRWYAGDTLVAEGYRNGNGTINCTEKNGSGLSITCDITYTGDLKPGIALMDIEWPKSYQIHYSTSVLTFPRTPEATVPDNGNDEYFYMPNADLPAGAYNYQVLQVDDENDIQGGFYTTPSDSPLTVNAAPVAPSNLSVGYLENLLIRSEEFDNAAWVKTGYTVTPNAIANPLDGALTADLLGEIGSGPFVLQTQPTSNFLPMTFSVYVRALGRRYVDLQLQNAGITKAKFDLVNGVVTITSGGPSTRIDSLGNEWYRISITATGNWLGGSDCKIQANDDDNNLFPSFSPDGSKGLYVYGAQVSLSAYPLSYIATAASQFLRQFAAVWSKGEAGCTYKIYSSPVNEPINYGSRATPAPVGPTAVDATQQVLTAPTTPSAIDLTSAYNTLASSFDSAVSTANTAFAAGESGFSAAMTTLETSINNAIDTFAASLKCILRDEKTAVSKCIATVTLAESSVASLGLATATWKNFIGASYGQVLIFLGALLEGNSGRYYLPGAIAPGVSAGTGTVTSTGPDGSVANTTDISKTLKQAAQPFVRNCYFRYAIRATKGGLEERNDVEFLYELDSGGTEIQPRPNDARIVGMSFTGSNLIVTVGVVEDDAHDAATVVRVMYGTKGGALSSSVDANLPTAVGGYHEVAVNLGSLSGWKDIAAVAVSDKNAVSDKYVIFTRYFQPSVTIAGFAASGISGKVLGGKPVRPAE